MQSADLESFLQSEKALAYTFIDELFQIHPPRPEIIVSDENLDSDEVITYRQAIGVKPSGQYIETNKSVIVFPSGFNERIDDLKKVGFKINEQESAISLLANLYANHAQSYLYGFRMQDTLDREVFTYKNNFLAKIDPRTEKVLSGLALPLAFPHAVSIYSTMKFNEHHELSKDMEAKVEYEEARHLRASKKAIAEHGKSTPSFVSLVYYYGIWLGRKFYDEKVDPIPSVWGFKPSDSLKNEALAILK